MNVRSPHILLAVALGTSTVAADDSGAQTALISVKPGKCVALKRGNVCYQTIVLEWRAPDTADYCVYPEHRLAPLRCWTQSQLGRLRFEFASADSLRFELRKLGEPNPLAEAEVEVRWVYKRRRDRSFGWRLF